MELTPPAAGVACTDSFMFVLDFACLEFSPSLRSYLQTGFSLLVSGAIPPGLSSPALGASQTDLPPLVHALTCLDSTLLALDGMIMASSMPVQSPV